MSLYGLSTIIASLGIIISILIVYFKSSSKKIATGFILTFFVVLLWIIGCLGESFVKDKNLALFFDKILYTGVILSPSVYFLFVLYFTDEFTKKTKVIALLNFIISSFFLLLNFSQYRNLLIKEVEYVNFRYLATPGIFLYFYLTFYTFVILVGLKFLYDAYLKANSIKKLQIKYFLLSTVVLATGGLFYFLLVLRTVFLPIDNLFTISSTGLFVYTCLKYHLMDINIVIKKSTLFAWKVLFPVLLFVLFVSFGQPMFIKYLPLWLWWLTVAIFGCIMAYYLYNKTIQILKLKDEELEKEKYTYREKLRAYTQDITRAESFEEAATYIVRKVSLIGRIDFCAIARLKQVFEEDKQKNYYEIVKVANRTKRDLRHLKGLKISEEFPLVQHLKQTKSYVEKGYLKFFLETKGYDKWYYLSVIKDMDVLNAEVVFPAFLNQQLYGFLILGNKLDGSPYYKPDLELFEILTAQAASFIAEVVEREEKIRLFLASWQTSLKALDAKDHYTYGHTQRVKEYCRMLAKHERVISDLSRVKEGLWGLEVAAELHDIGKLGIPDNILNKPTKLSQEEYEKIKSHPIEGKKILEPLKNWLKENIISGVVQHHENYNGSGYPFGLRGKEIHIYARIIRIADSVDAMSTKRPYRDPLTKQYIIEELLRYKGIYYDPHLTDAFLEVYTEETEKLEFETEEKESSFIKLITFPQKIAD